MNKQLKWVLILVIAAVLFFGVFKAVSQTPAGTSQIEDHIIGSVEAAVSLVEYSDFQCPACGAYHPILKQLVEDFENEISFTYRHFPLSQIHQNAEMAARASESAGKQGKFWEMHDLIFENQTKWSGMKDARGEFMQYAEELGLDIDLFKNDLKAKDVRDKVKNDFKSGLSLNVDSTPSFYINGEKLNNPRTYEEFKNIIEEAINNTNQ